MSARALSLLVLAALCACAAPAPGTQPLHLAITPAAQPVSAAVAACIPREATVQLDVAFAPDPAEHDLVIQLGEPTELPDFAAQLATEEIMLATNPESDVALTPALAAEIFSGRTADWEVLGGTPGTIELWVSPASDEARLAFEGDVLLGAPVAGDAHLVTDLAAMVAAVEEDPHAIAVLPAAWVGETLETTPLELELPVLALAESEPSGTLRSLVACLQGEVGQVLLAERYTPLEQ